MILGGRLGAGRAVVGGREGGPVEMCNEVHDNNGWMVIWACLAAVMMAFWARRYPKAWFTLGRWAIT
jgi:hypothetical protein